MKTILRNALALLAGLLLGGAVNMALVLAGPQVVAPPPGVNMADANSLAASVHLLEPRHFLFPFLAHALGTLAGATAAFLIAIRHRTAPAYVVGAFFLAGGIAASAMIPAPTWFVALDLLAAYLPMAWLSTVLGKRLTGSAPVQPRFRQTVIEQA